MPELAQRGGEEGMPGQMRKTTYLQWPAAAFQQTRFLSSSEQPPSDSTDASADDAGSLALFVSDVGVRVRGFLQVSGPHLAKRHTLVEK